MGIFDDRARAFEGAFAHEQELNFKIIAQRNRLLAEWAAALIGMTSDARKAYVDDMVSHAVSDADPHTVLRLIATDLDLHQTHVSRRYMVKKAHEFEEEAHIAVFTQPLTPDDSSLL